ncbi:MAG: trypsin-like serine protease [Phycisphaerae bacterium]|nr:trypsin-like serine protease [Phycisphaerae bacterium]
MNAKVLFPTKWVSRLLAGAVALPLITTGFSGPAWAITGGEVDENNTYSNVGAVVWLPPDGSGPSVGCSGILIHPRVLLTAGHGTIFPEENPWVIPLSFVSFGTNALDPSTWHEVQTVITHPNYNPLAWNQSCNDVGVIILKRPVRIRKVPLAKLPDEGFLDDLKTAGLLREPGQGGVPFIVAGYGSTGNWPPQPPPEVVPVDGLRRFAHSDYLALSPGWLYTLMNPATGNGGTGYGDSGGPAFWVKPDGTLVLVALTGHGDPNLVAINVAWRVDLPETLDFIDWVINTVLPSLPRH